VSESPKTEPSVGATDEPVPKLPRGRGMKFSGPEMFRIGLTLVTLIGVVVLMRPCANAVSGFVTSFDGSGSAKQQQMPKPGTVDMPRDEEYERLKPGMTPEQIKAAMERSKARNAAANGAPQGSAANGSAVNGTASPTGSSATKSGSAVAPSKP
jgi:hypothetical protein